MLALLVVAVALGVSNLAAAVGIGMSGADGRTKARLALIYGLFEAGMPLLGLALGHDLASEIGQGARWLGGGLLISIGVYECWQAWREGRDRGDAGAARRSPPGLGRLVVSGLALSLDNLAVGFALGAYHLNIVLAAVVIGAVSVAMSLAGVELGARLGALTAGRAGLVAGAALTAVGAAILAGAL